MNNIRRICYASTKYRKCINSCRYYSNGSLYEPDYLESMKSKIPLYEALNIQLTGHDYSILESYQKLVHNLTKNMDIDVEDGWSLPPQEIQVVNYKPKSDLVNAQYKLKTYQRTIQVSDISTLQLPILLRAIEASLPAGVTVNIVNHEDYHEEVRYVPDKELVTLKQELEDMGGPRKK